MEHSANINTEPIDVEPIPIHPKDIAILALIDFRLAEYDRLIAEGK